MYFISPFLAFVSVAWYYSKQIFVLKPYSLMPEFKILAISEETFTLLMPNSKAQVVSAFKLSKGNLPVPVTVDTVIISLMVLVRCYLLDPKNHLSRTTNLLPTFHHFLRYTQSLKYLMRTDYD